MYIVISKPKRMSVKLGVVHCIDRPSVHSFQEIAVGDAGALPDAERPARSRKVHAGPHAAPRAHARRPLLGEPPGRERQPVAKTQQSVPRLGRALWRRPPNRRRIDAESHAESHALT